MTGVQIVCLVVIAACAPTSVALAGVAVIAWLFRDRGHHGRVVQSGVHQRGLPLKVLYPVPPHVATYVARGGAPALRRPSRG